MKKLLPWFFALVLAVALLYINSQVRLRSSPNNFRPSATETSTPSTTENAQTSGATDPRENYGESTEPSQGFKYEEIICKPGTEVKARASFTQKGDFTVSYSNYRLATRVPDEGGVVGDSCSVLVKRGDEREQFEYWGIYNSPSFVLENGEFIDGVYLVLIDVSIKNVDAEAYTIYDLNDFGQPLGFNDDPYLFSEPTFQGFRDNHGYASGVSCDYFSNLNKGCEEEASFRLEPGASTTYTVGFFIGNGDMREIEDLFVFPGGRGGKHYIFPLNLSCEDAVKAEE